MTIGFIGLGKLGFPTVLAIASKGHEVVGYDVDPRVKEWVRARTFPHKEEGAQELLDRNETLWVADTVAEVVRLADIVFVAVQTPHRPKYEGVTRLPEERSDFNYTWLRRACLEVAEAARTSGKETILAVVSTVLPGTVDREIKPVLDPLVRLCYNPAFTAMGTTIGDFLAPEFVLLGVDDEGAARKVEAFYRTLHDRPLVRMSVKSAELAKVGYNVFIGFKLSVTNALMEICHKTGADVDDVMRALKMANERIVSPKYMDAGMGDGGPCHPRDAIALSWLARETRLSRDVFEDLMLARECQTEWLARLVLGHAVRRGLQVAVLGRTYKPGTDLVSGSPAVLLVNILNEWIGGLKKEHGEWTGIAGLRKVEAWDPMVDTAEPAWLRMPHVFVIATRHPEFARREFPEGSLIIDPFGYVPDQDGIGVVRLGRRSRSVLVRIKRTLRWRR